MLQGCCSSRCDDDDDDDDKDNDNDDDDDDDATFACDILASLVPGMP